VGPDAALAARVPVSLWTDFLGAEIRFVDVGGVPTRVVTLGDHGPTVVLVHGRGGHLEAWRANVRPLAKTARVVAFDLLGHGLTGRHDGGYGVAELTAHAVATLDALGLSDVVLVGQSIGGWISVRVALGRPDLVRQLVLVEPAGFQTEAERLADPRVAAAYARGGKAFAEPTEDAVRDRLLGLVADPAAIDDELVAARRALYAPNAARDVHRAVRQADNAPWVLTPDVMARLRCPTTIVHGALANTPTAVVEAAAGAAGARLITVPDVKQWPQLEAPDVVNPLLSDIANP
jgi:2-hydroxy-6-oxonona-2,4-dienedioate hydrolase